MYRVEKDQGRTAVYDNNDKCIYSAADDSFLIYQPAGLPIQIASVKKLSDVQLLTALASVVRLSLE